MTSKEAYIPIVPKHLKLFIQDAPVAIAMFDRQMNYLACSHQWIKDWWVKNEPITMDQIIGKNHYDLFGDVSSYWQSVHQRAMMGATEYNENDQFVKENGKKEWLRWETRPWKDEKGVIGGIILFTEFITTRKEAENLLINSQAKLTKLVENLPGMAYSSDADKNWTLRFISSGSLETTGYKPSDFVSEKGMPFSDIIHPDDKEKVLQNIHQCLRIKHTFEVSYRIYTKSGEIKHLFERGQGVYDPEGKLISIEGIILDITSQKLMEEALNKSRTSLSLAQKVSNIGSWEWNIKTNEVFWSDELYHICGITADEINPTYETARDFIHPDDLAMFREHLFNVSEKKNTQVEFRILRKDNTTRFLVGQSRLVNTKSKIAVGTLQDVTEQKLRELALRESQERNKSMIRAFPDAIFIHKLDGTIIDYEIPSNFTLKFTHDQLMGKKLSSIFGSNTVNQLKEAFALASSTNELQTLEFNYTRNNAVKFFEARIVLHNYDKIMLVLRDITKNKEIEFSASESLNSFYTAFHISPIPVSITLMDDGQLIEVNDRFCDLVKMKRNNIIGKTFISLGLWKNEATRARLVKKLNKEGRINGLEAQLHVGDNTIIDVLLSAEAINITGNSCILLMISDISERKKHENQLIKLTEELTASNHDLRQFAYITSHNLRAPLINIDSLLSFVDKKKLGTTENLDMVERIETSVNQLKSSLNDLIQLVAIRDKRYEADETVCFKEIFELVYRSIETQILNSNASIETNFKVSCFSFKKPLLESILLNLISNAIKYKSRQAPRIVINTMDEGDYICMSVADNGLGIDLKKNKDKIFGMYQRFHPTRDGKGLGLYIIKSQIESMKGKIEVESEPYNGTTFKVYFKKQ